MDWKDLLILAEELVKPECSIAAEETRIRTAISRSYYYLFLTSRDWLERNRVPYRPLREEDSKGPHADVIIYLKENAVTDLSILGARLDQLRQNRVDVDYYLDMQARCGTSAKDLWLKHYLIVKEAERIILRNFQ